MAFQQYNTRKLSTLPLFICAAAAIVSLLVISPLESLLRSLWIAADLTSNGLFVGLGAIGAIFANSTGAGGGVVFIPAFSQLGFSESQAVATSFGIQCFGMTAGALTWSRFYRREKAQDRQWRPFLPIVALGALASISGLWTAFTLNLDAPAALSPMFAGFSLFLGMSILVMVLRQGCGQFRSRLSLLDLAALPVIAFGGGMVTAWLSVGVGEFIAFYLILRRYDVTLSIATAVVISAISVWSAAPEQLFFGQQANWQILAFAGPGAVVGGLIARHLVLILGAHKLKIFFGSWLLIIGLVELISIL